MDERFFAYMDDVDLCVRARKAGWTVWYEPAGTAIHLMGQATKRQTGQASPLALQSLFRWFAMHRGATSVTLFRAMAALGFSVRAAMYGAASLRHSQLRDAARAHLANARRSLVTIQKVVER